MFTKPSKIIISLFIAFFLSQFIGKNVFINSSPRFNPQFLAALPKQFTNLAEALNNQANGTGNAETGLVPEDQCPEPSGTETYNNILPVGTHMAANINPVNYVLVRKLYNCDNPQNDQVKGGYIPVTVIYDLFFLKGNVGAISNNLKELKKYGLFPMIRVASYTSGANWIKIGPDDAKIMGQNLRQALSEVTGFPQKPMVMFGNEVNLHAEWGGQINPGEFATALASFMDGMGEGNHVLFFPALSWGADGVNGQRPPEFVTAVFASSVLQGKHFSGAALNIYGPDSASISSQAGTQKGAFDPVSEFFNQPLSSYLSEYGPTKNGPTINDCSQTGDWPKVMAPMIKDFIQAPPVPFATASCFNANSTIAIIAHYDGTEPRLITLTAGGPPPGDNPTATPTSGTQPTPTPTVPPGGSNPTPTPTSAPGGTNPTPTVPPGGNKTGKNVQIVVHENSIDGTIISDQSITVDNPYSSNKSLLVYLEGPTAKGRFGELMAVPGSAKNSCTSRGGFPYSCEAGKITWKGADGTSGTGSGSYTVTLVQPPPGWEKVDGADSGTGNLGENDSSLVLHVAIKKTN